MGATWDLFNQITWHLFKQRKDSDDANIWKNYISCTPRSQVTWPSTESQNKLYHAAGQWPKICKLYDQRRVKAEKQ